MSADDIHGVTVEYGIPIPPKANGVSAFTGLIRSMRVGGSVFLAEERRLQHAQKLMTLLGWKYEQRKISGGWRIWRKT